MIIVSHCSRSKESRSTINIPFIGQPTRGNMEHVYWQTIVDIRHGKNQGLKILGNQTRNRNRWRNKLNKAGRKSNQRMYWEQETGKTIYGHKRDWNTRHGGDIYIYIYIYIYISAVKWLIMINCIQNKSLCLCVLCLYIL